MSGNKWVKIAPEKRLGLEVHNTFKESKLIFQAYSGLLLELLVPQLKPGTVGVWSSCFALSDSVLVQSMRLLYKTAHIASTFNIEHSKMIPLSSVGVWPGVLLIRLAHYWVAWLVTAQHSSVAKQRLSQGGSADMFITFAKLRLLL